MSEAHMVERDAGRLERMLGWVLRAGSILSTALLAVGLGLAFVNLGAGADVYLNAGLVVLMATPVARVIVSVVEYAGERDWTFVALTSTVLLVLAGSLLVAIRH